MISYWLTYKCYVAHLHIMYAAYKNYFDTEHLIENKNPSVWMCFLFSFPLSKA